MDIIIHGTFPPRDDPVASLASHRDTLGFEVRDDVGYAGTRWAVGPRRWAGPVDIRASRSF